MTFIGRRVIYGIWRSVADDGDRGSSILKVGAMVMHLWLQGSFLMDNLFIAGRLLLKHKQFLFESLLCSYC